MNSLLSRLPLRAFMGGALIFMTFGCVVDGGGYGYDGGGGIGAAYYEPYGFGYGGWGADYNVAPYYRGGDGRRGNVGGAHAYRSAPASRSMPSIAGARSGGGRSGGGRSGSGRR